MKRARNQCFMCTSCTCHFRIHTEDGEFDEIACNRHSGDLEKHADQILGNPGKMRQHITSTDKLKRDKRKVPTTAYFHCPDCQLKGIHVKKPEYSFGKHKSKTTGKMRRNTYCKGCHRERTRKWQREHPRKVIEAQIRYNERRLEKLRGQLRELDAKEAG